MSMQATAIKEAFEESGLQVAIISFIGDFDRTLTRTRYYLAKRVGGTPAKMGWESQAVLLVPSARLGEYLAGAANASVLAAFEAL
jgi:8-oxo-dGTP pyrophosphatase MutT (NUDIX family)